MDGPSCLTPLDTTPNDQHNKERAWARQAAQRALATIKGRTRARITSPGTKGGAAADKRRLRQKHDNNRARQALPAGTKVYLQTMPYTSKTRSLSLSGDRRISWDCTSSTATFRKESHERGRADGRIRTDKHPGHPVLASKRWRGRLTASGQTPQRESASLAGPSGVSPAGHIAMDKGMLGDRKGR